MSILIRGMKLPKSCAFCKLKRRNGKKMVCPLLNEEWDIRDPMSADFQLNNCPLGPVPAHGRLIDESAIDLSKYEKAAHDALHNGKGSILYDCGVLAGARAITQLVRRAPTIIPAEECEA